MAERQGGTTAIRRRRPRRLNLRFGRAPGYYGGPSAPAIMRKGRLRRRGHDDGPRRRAPAKACALLRLTELEQRALEDAVGCWGGGGAVAVVLEWPGASCARL